MPLSAPIKTQLNAMLHCIQNFTNTFEVTMQVKQDIQVGKTILHKLHVHVPIKLVLSLHIIWLRYLYKVFTCVGNVQRS